MKSSAGEECFDKVVIPSHADQTYNMLAEPTALQTQILTKFQTYSNAKIVLHTDASLLPPNRERWSGWNYGRISWERRNEPFLTYWMNALQRFDAEQDYFISSNPPVAIDEEKVIATFDYEHPRLTTESFEVQKDIYKMNRSGPIYFCGAYFHNKVLGPDTVGFHESGYCAGVEVAKRLKKLS